jgi:hypothetical protein
MVTFMPMMAFADQIAGEAWNADYSSVTVTQADKTTKTYKNIKKTWDATTGLVTAQVDWTDYVGEHDQVNASIQYYDFNYAKIKTGANWNRAWFYGYDKEKGTIENQNIRVVLTKPSYVADANVNGDKNAEVTYTENQEDNLDVTVYYAGYDETDLSAQTVTLSATVVPGGTGEATTHHAEYVDGTIAGATITVGEGTASENDVLLAIDKVTKTSEKAKTWTIPTQTYDGASHKLVTNTVPGFTVSWKVQNATSKKYEDVAEVAFKDKGTYNVAVVITNDKTKTSTTYYKTITVDGAGAVKAGFDKYDYELSGTEFDPWDFVEIYPAEDTNLKSVKANKEALKEAVKSAYEITQTPDKYDKNKVSLKLDKKADFDGEAFYKANKALFDNFEGKDTLTNVYDEADVYTNVGTREDDVTFTKAEGQKYSYKKHLKKKSKSFTVVAEAESGKTVKYSIVSSNTKKIVIDAVTGKITVKKGLKKGTYTVVVKAKTTAGNGYRIASDKAEITVKVTK